MCPTFSPTPHCALVPSCSPVPRCADPPCAPQTAQDAHRAVCEEIRAQNLRTAELHIEEVQAKRAAEELHKQVGACGSGGAVGGKRAAGTTLLLAYVVTLRSLTRYTQAVERWTTNKAAAWAQHEKDAAAIFSLHFMPTFPFIQAVERWTTNKAAAWAQHEKDAAAAELTQKQTFVFHSFPFQAVERWTTNKAAAWAQHEKDAAAAKATHLANIEHMKKEWEAKSAEVCARAYMCGGREYGARTRRC